MTFFRRPLAIAIILIFILFAKPLGATAAPIDLLLLLDNSGSMATNDPEGLRYVAARLAVDQLEDIDQVGVFSFASTVEEIFPLSPLSAVEQRTHLQELLDIRAVSGGYTDIKGAVAAAARQFAESGRPEASPVVLLLTDGVPDPGPGLRQNRPFMEGYVGELATLVEELAATGVTVYGVGLTEEANLEFLEQVTTPTQGWSRMVQEAEELTPVFLEILAELKPEPEEPAPPEPISPSVVEASGPEPELERQPALGGMWLWVLAGAVLVATGAMVIIRKCRRSKLAPPDPDVIKRLDKYIN